MSRSLRPRIAGVPLLLAVVLDCSLALAVQAPPEEDDLEIPAASPAQPRPSNAPAPPAAADADTQRAEREGEAAEGDDLELPAAPLPVPAPAAPPVQTPPAAPDVSSPAPGVEAPVPAQAPATPPSSPLPVAPSNERAEPAADARATGIGGVRTGNLERTVHSRPIPWGLLLSGFLQADYLQNQLSEDQLEQSGAPYNRDEFVLRAARLRIDGGYQHAAYTLELDASTSGGPQVGVRRAEATLLYRSEGDVAGAASGQRREAPPLMALTAGLTDMPFGNELVESSRTRAFLERTLGSESIFPTQMDAGVKLHGGFEFMRYALAFVNGEPVLPGAYPRDPNSAKDIVGRFGIEARLGDHVAISGGTSFGFGKGFHPGRVAVKDEVIWRDDNSDGVAIPSELVGVPGAAATPSQNFERWVLGLDLQLGVESGLGLSRLVLEALVASNHDRGLYASDPIDAGFDLRQLAAHAALTQQITKYGLVGFRIDTYDPNSDFIEERRGLLLPRSQSFSTLSPLVGLVLPERGRVVFQYDFVRDHLGRDAAGLPTDARNHRFGARLQVDL